VSGSLVETTVDQDAWNVNNLDGSVNQNKTMNPATTLIYWFNIEWLGVGAVDCGIVVDKELVLCHRFRHSNILSTAYIKTASLQPTYEIISTGGAGSMRSICYTAISEGGYRPIGYSFSINMGVTTQAVNNREPVLAIRLKSGSISNVRLRGITTMATSGANYLVELWRFVDTPASAILNNSSFSDVNAESDVEYNTAAASIILTGGLLLASAYTSNNNDAISLSKFSETTTLSINGASVSDLLVVCIQTIGSNEQLVVSMDWAEVI
jgi:hypothetical protein